MLDRRDMPRHGPRRARPLVRLIVCGFPTEPSRSEICTSAGSGESVNVPETRLVSISCPYANHTTPDVFVYFDPKAGLELIVPREPCRVQHKIHAHVRRDRECVIPPAVHDCPLFKVAAPLPVSLLVGTKRPRHHIHLTWHSH